MGDPKFQRKKYSTPRHPWEKTRIDEERKLLNDYGLKNKRELWKSQSLLDSFRTQARSLQAKMRTSDENSRVQFQNMINRLNRYGILGANATLDDILSLTVDSILARRLETVVFRKHLAGTPKQARQLITHGQIMMNGRIVNIPSILVERSFEDTVDYNPHSPISDEDHPLRRVLVSGSAEEEKPETPEENQQEQKEAEKQ
ncbi:MAG: 30S ribosomal protein S4 [Candidatus Thermoplasmatota archaeon]|nr:30S ribosomal protein S4 [Candidatus Thermoplasmatota archaeon]